MNRQVRAHQRTTWITLWAMLLSTCLPVLSHAAVHWADGTEWMDVCTSTGMVRVRAEPIELTDKTTPESAEVACSWCLAASGAPGLPQPGFSFVVSTEPAGPGPSRLADRIWLPAVWSLAQPRAPPVAL